jgi:hypothetical protein
MPKNRKATIRNRKRTGFSLSKFPSLYHFGVEPVALPAASIPWSVGRGSFPLPPVDYITARKLKVVADQLDSRL